MTLEECAIAVLGQGAERERFAQYSFIQLGGDSLRALRLVAMAQDRLGVRIPVARLLGDSALGQVLREPVAIVAPERTAEYVPTPGGLGSHADRALSHTQQGMWLAQQAADGSQYNLVFIAFPSWAMQDAEIQEAISAVTARHEGLRTVFQESALQEDGGVIRRVVAAYQPRLESVDCDAEEDFGPFVRSVAAACGKRRFDVAAEPALAFVHVRTPGRRSALIIIAHHMILDGWAVGLLLRELFASLGSASQDPAGVEHAVPVRELFLYQEEQQATGEWNRQAEFWKGHLPGVPATLDLPADRPRPTMQDPAGARVPVELSAAISASIIEYAKQAGITPFAILLGAFGLALGRWTSARNFLIGVPLTGRGTARLERLVAVVGNLVPVRIDIDDDLSAGNYLRQVQRSLALSIENGALPFDRLLTALAVKRGGGCHPLVQVSFGMHDQLVPGCLSTPLGQVLIEEAHGGGSQFDLTLLVGQADPAFAGSLEYATGVWSAAEAEAFAADLTQAATELVTSPEAPLQDARCIAPERLRVLEEINATRREFPAVSLDGAFLAMARRAPHAVAIRDEAYALTYAQLAAAAARQARLLRDAGVAPGDRVVVGVPRSIAEVVAVLGTVCAGASYIGIDLSQPAAHTGRIVARSAPAAALVSPADARRFTDAGIPVPEIWSPAWATHPGNGHRVGDASPQAAADPRRIAYVAFTSGSTGTPKGVCVPHRAVTRLVCDAPYLCLGPGERMLRLSPLAFDASTLEVWGALLTGATLEVYPEGVPTPAELGAFVAERGITVAWLTAGFFRLVAEFATSQLGRLRQLLTGGDVVPHDHAARLLAKAPGMVLTNGYGPTENTTFTTVYSVTSPQEITGPLPIGTPVPGTRVYVLDGHRRVVPPGAVGELYTGGEGLADGYLGDEAETQRRFGRFSPDVPERLYRTGDLARIDTAGRLRFLGRADDQVKLRGYRIEPSEISSLLSRHPQVKDAVVIVVGDDSDDKRLLAACVPAHEADPRLSPAVLRDFVARELPSYMVPALWAIVDRVPVTGNGKVDRAALAVLSAPAVAQPPDDPRAMRAQGHRIRARVDALFHEALGNVDIGDDEDFFLAGGDSLSAVRMMSHVSQEFDVELRLREFLLSPTPAGLTRLIEDTVRARECEAGR